MFQIDVIFHKHTLDLADIEAVFTMTMFLKVTASQSLELTASTPLGVTGLRL